ncbi:hypothetical protein BTW00_02085 [Psychrobacter sp. C 20.9]|uniref:hypothetical protein n=1 Tax=Psychrobacter sp. C 20.9 TaxID=1926477 RepID=UPI000946EE37|nr:hypothetical protein [Psychrobacter sp. C 20.9]OLF37972.1 hypothetical protein BTW00_02085 [Psychrobacter sp. C 20.9]
MNNTKERPIVLTVQEVKAVLAGDKTQHRVPFDFEFIKEANVPIVQKVADETNCTLSELVTGAYQDGSVYDFECPLGKVGDRLWVQEPTHTANSWDWFYDATHSLVECKDPYTPSDLYLPWDDDHQEYTGPIDAEHMPYWASRILLEITDIRIERIKDISEADAKAMGLKPDYCDHKYQTCEDIGCIGIWASALFLHLRHEKKLAVHYTDWVWVIDFKAIEGVHTNG